MRITRPMQVVLAKSTPSTLEFEGQRGEHFLITALDDDLIRVRLYTGGLPRLDRTWLAAGPQGETPLTGRDREDLSPFRLPPVEIGDSDEFAFLRTAQMQVEAALGSFSLRWADAQGRYFAADVPGWAYSYDGEGRSVTHNLQRMEGERYYGFGEKSGPLEKTGRRLKMEAWDAFGYNAETSDPLYKHFPFYITYMAGLDIAYGLFYDNLSTAVFDLGSEVSASVPSYRYYQAEDGDIDYYLIFGPSIAEVVQKFSALTGRMPLPPRWSLGYLASTMEYTEDPQAQARLEEFSRRVRAEDIPCDGLHLSSGYVLDARGKRQMFEWNRERVPDPAGLVETYHRAGLKLAANVKPALFPSHPRYEEVRSVEGFIRRSGSLEPLLSPFWGGKAAHIDFTNPYAYDWWRRRATETLLALGVDSLWNDNNEYLVLDESAECDGFGQPFSLSQARPLQTLLMARASREAQQAHRPEERPFTITRGACPGMQRYAQTWSGDNVTSWETMRFNLPMGLGLGLSGMPSYGHDVGGFTGERPSPELLLRWVQNGVFHPRFCIHSWKTDQGPTEPWMYPEVAAQIREWIGFRYRLLPYLYTLFVEASRSGAPILRPLVYAYPRDSRCQYESFDFLCGPNLLVAPVLEEGARERTVYLPGASPWCDFFSGEWLAPGQVARRAAALNQIPLLAPAGALIPTGRAMQYVGQLPDDLRRVYAFPAPQGGEGRFTLVEDDGLSLAYRDGAFSEVELALAAGAESVALSARVTRDGWPLPYRAVEFILPPGEMRALDLPAGSRQWEEYGRRIASVPLAAD